MGEAQQAAQPGGPGAALLTPADEEKFLADWPRGVLTGLRAVWRTAYEIGVGPVSQFAARRRDGTGDWLIAEDPYALGAMMAADWGDRPVPAS